MEFTIAREENMPTWKKLRVSAGHFSSVRSNRGDEAPSNTRKVNEPPNVGCYANYGFFSRKNRLLEGFTRFRKFVPPVSVGLLLADQLAMGVVRLPL